MTSVLVMGRIEFICKDLFLPRDAQRGNIINNDYLTLLLERQYPCSGNTLASCQHLGMVH